MSDYIPSAGEFDPLADETHLPQVPGDIEAPREKKDMDRKPRPLLEFFSPSQLRAYEPPGDAVLLGDYHLQRGGISVLAGPPGCGKSRATLWLAALGATAIGQRTGSGATGVKWAKIRDSGNRVAGAGRRGSDSGSLNQGSSIA